MSYDTHLVAVQCFGWDGMIQGKQTQSKLFSQTLADETGVGAGVDEGSQGLRSTRQEQTSRKGRTKDLRSLEGRAHPYLLSYE